MQQKKSKLAKMKNKEDDQKIQNSVLFFISWSEKYFCLKQNNENGLRKECASHSLEKLFWKCSSLHKYYL